MQAITFVKLKSKSQKTPSRNPPYRFWPRKSNADESKEVGHTHTDTLDENERKSERGRKLTSPGSGRAVRHIPSSPSLILSGMKKRGKKPSVTSISDADEDRAAWNSNFIKSSIKTINNHKCSKDIKSIKSC
nr:titin homolog isoform X2 [Ipomoea trifida]